MKNLFMPFIFSFFVLFIGYGQNQTLFFQTDWGYNGSVEDFVKKAKNSGYDGIEIWLPAEPKKKEDNFKCIKKI